MDMQFIHDVFGQGAAIVRDIAVADGALVEGALLIAGTTEVNATAVVGVAPYTNVVGRLLEASGSSSGTVSAGTFEYKKVIVNPGGVYRAQFSLTGTASYTAAATASSDTTQFTFGSSDDHFEGGYIYTATGTGAGQLYYIKTASTTVFDTLSTIATAADATTYCAKIPGSFCADDAGTTGSYGFLDLDSTALLAISDEDATGKFGILGRYIEYDGAPLTELVRATHDGLTGLNSKNVRFYIDIIALSHAFNSYIS